MIQVQPERSPFAQDQCRCSRCGGLLTRYDFRTDGIGRMVENCERCGPRLLAVRHGVPAAAWAALKAPRMGRSQGRRVNCDAE